MVSFLSLFTAFSLFTMPISSPISLESKPKVLASHEFSLENRYDNPSVNYVFKDNILLNLAYLKGQVQNKSQIDWNTVLQPSVYSFTLAPGQTFAYHDQVLDKYKASVVKTTNAHFNAQEGFISDGYLYGDGVCHFASLIGWAAKDANLEVVSPTNHDFMKINQIPKEQGVSIYATPGNITTSANQNLYITNNRNSPVQFNFTYDGQNLQVSVEQIS